LHSGVCAERRGPAGFVGVYRQPVSRCQLRAELRHDYNGHLRAVGRCGTTPSLGGVCAWRGVPGWRHARCGCAESGLAGVDGGRGCGGFGELPFVGRRGLACAASRCGDSAGLFAREWVTCCQPSCWQQVTGTGRFRGGNPSAWRPRQAPARTHRWWILPCTPSRPRHRRFSRRGGRPLFAARRSANW